MRVAIVDDHPVFAELLGLALDAEPDMAWVGHASDETQLLSLVEEQRPDVVVMDLHLGSGPQGVDLTAALRERYPEIKVLVLTALKDHRLAIDATTAGAVGFMQKDGALGDVIDAVRAAHRGYLLVSHAVLAGMARLVPADPVTARPGPLLTSREREVLRLLGQGLKAREVADRLGLSEHTARTHIHRVLAKLDAHTQLEAVVVARRLGLLSPDAG